MKFWKHQQYLLVVLCLCMVLHTSLSDFPVTVRSSNSGTSLVSSSPDGSVSSSLKSTWTCWCSPALPCGSLPPPQAPPSLDTLHLLLPASLHLLLPASLHLLLFPQEPSPLWSPCVRWEGWDCQLHNSFSWGPEDSASHGVAWSPQSSTCKVEAGPGAVVPRQDSPPHRPCPAWCLASRTSLWGNLWSLHSSQSSQWIPRRTWTHRCSSPARPLEPGSFGWPGRGAQAQDPAGRWGCRGSAARWCQASGRPALGSGGWWLGVGRGTWHES